jgi:tyrosyl-tRNA synthetase
MDPKAQLEALRRGVVAITTEAELLAKLEEAAKAGRPLRVKLGVDPTAPDIHLGHTVVLRKLRQFQDLGHLAVLIIGDYTARVGDPSGREKTRPALSPEAIASNAATYLEQAGRVLDTAPGKLELVRNGQWLGPLSFEKLLALAAHVTVARFLERDDFSERYKKGVPIGLHEFLYPVMQGYDSVAVRADVELGGTDQTFNLMVGRDFQREHGQAPQVAMTLPILVGLDGSRKMSKSYGNHIGVAEDPRAMFGKTMSIPDAAMKDWYTLLTGVPLGDVVALADPARTHPREAKDRLAREIVANFHGEASAREASGHFAKVVSRKERPEEIPNRPLALPAPLPDAIPLPRVIKDLRLAPSTSAARALIAQGAVEINDRKVTDVNAAWKPNAEDVWKVGKKGVYFRVQVKPNSPSNPCAQYDRQPSFRY